MTDQPNTDVELYHPGVVLPLSPAEVDTVKAVLAPGVSDAELALFVKVANHLGLSPFRDELALVGRYSSEARRKVYKHQVTVHGRRVLAARTGELRGIDGPEWTGPRDARGGHTWVDVWDEDEPPHAARVFVYRAGWAKPVNGTVRWLEFAQRDGQGNLMAQWARMPAHMLGKVAEALALRRAFPEVITAAVAGEWDDIDQAEPPATPPAGGEGGPGREASITRPPDPGRGGPPMTDDQTATIATYLAQLGLAGQDMRAARMRYLSDVLRRDVGDVRTITWEEAERLIAALVAAVAALHEPEPPEQPEPEGEPDDQAEEGAS